jgi:hypothetical protein
MNDPAVRGLLVQLLSATPDLSIFRQPAIWSTLKENSPTFGMAQLVAYIGRPHVSVDEKKWCDQRLRQSWMRLSRSLSDLEHVVSVLDDEGIQAIPLKGPLLALRHYKPAFVRRPSTDLDLAVRDRDLERACSALTRAGYTSSESLQDWRASCHEAKLIHKSRMNVELHFRLSHGPFGIPTDELFGGARESTLPSGRRTWSLDPADELLHLALHHASDRFHSFFHQYELQRLWTASPVELREEAIRKAVKHGFAGALALIEIGFALRWNQAFLPPGVSLPKTWLHWRVNRNLYESLEGWFEPDRKLSTRLRGRWLDLQATDTPTSALRLAFIVLRVAGLRLKTGGWRPMPPTPFA